MWLFELLEQAAGKCAEEKARVAGLPTHTVERSIKSGPVLPRIVQAGEYAARLASTDMADREVAFRKFIQKRVRPQMAEMVATPETTPACGRLRCGWPPVGS